MRLRFAIRDLLWLTALIAMGLGWWADRTHAAKALGDSQRVADNYRKREAQYIRDFNTVRLFMKGEEENDAIYDILNRVPRAAK